MIGLQYERELLWTLGDSWTAGWALVCQEMLVGLLCKAQIAEVRVA